MISNNKCQRCEEVETYKHLIWECGEAKKIWQLFNEFAISANQCEERILDYDNVFKIGNNATMNKVKIKVVQEIIQIERPSNWTINKIIKIAREMKRIEIYNAGKIDKLDLIKSKWNCVPNELTQKISKKIKIANRIEGLN